MIKNLLSSDDENTYTPYPPKLFNIFTHVNTRRYKKNGYYFVVWENDKNNICSGFGETMEEAEELFMKKCSSRILNLLLTQKL